MKWTARGGHRGIVELMLDRGEGKLTIENYNEAMEWAAQNGHQEIVELIRLQKEA